MTVQPEGTPPPRHETADERADRNLIELLQELRVLQTGVQIVFAFLLGVAFTDRFARLDDAQQDIYVATLLLTVVASAVLATPVAVHRGLFHRGAKQRIVALSTKLTQAGLVFLALALNGAVLLLTDVVLGRTLAITITSGSALMFTGLWFVLPWALRRP
ncbi:DUF6328 family protein [Kitasatospora sp. MAP5-34]|uniref:DUF6328 family protein n=1 Tax=Kitasatospora sp. MAP5-34 TaxID=3035102 RepID=UPI002474D200|nr:DUF6328 family protein [Kitasatospora sp. MAP5-34]MDH6579192.1 hypothetical protein [Kitasatospora sp. MAP5-34]